jgi:AbrB family looped-hinge helix DNA binding protein
MILTPHHIILLKSYILASIMTTATTRLSSKGQVIIPKSIRQSYRWAIGQEFTVEDTGEGVLLRPKSSFPRTTVEEVAGCLKYSGPPKTLEEMEDAIRKGVLEQWHDIALLYRLWNF